MSYRHLTYLQRCKIQAFRQAGYKQKEIASEIGVSPSTISRELKKHSRWNGRCSASQAGCEYKSTRKNSRKPKTFTSEVKTFVREKILLDWSPEQISGYAKKHHEFSVSHERIYQYIVEDKQSGGELYTHLRYGKKKYRKRYGSSKRIGPIKDRIMIDDRPSIVDEKVRLGDWEVDTIIGKQNQRAIVTLVERVSKKTLIGQVGSKNALFVKGQIIRLLTPIKSFVLTMTADNGTEFAEHKGIAAALGIKIYFAHPYHSWERGLNENTNGLIRQYIPKGKDFTELTETDIAGIQERLNNRPRKMLDYATPNEVFTKLQKTAA